MSTDATWSFESGEGWGGGTNNGYPSGWDGDLPFNNLGSIVLSSDTAASGSVAVKFIYTDLNTGSGPHMSWSHPPHTSGYCAWWYRIKGGMQTSPSDTKILFNGPNGTYPNGWFGMGFNNGNGRPYQPVFALQGGFDTTDTQTMGWNYDFPVDTWVRVILFFQMNTPGVADGNIKLFINGTEKSCFLSNAGSGPGNLTNRQLRGPTPTSNSWAGACPSTATWDFIRFYQERGIGNTYYDLVSWGTTNPDTGGGDTTIPTPPTVLLGSPTSTSLTATWSGATDNVGVTGYRIDVSPSNLFGSFVGIYQNLDVGNVASRLISGLTTGTTYYTRVRAYDGAGNVSNNSNTASGITVGDTTPPATPTGFTVT